MPATRWHTTPAELFEWIDENDIDLLDMFLPSLLTNLPPKDRGDAPLVEAEAPAPTLATDSEIVPILPLRGLVVFPHTMVPLTIGQPRSIKLIDDATSGSRQIGMFAATDPEKETPSPEDLYQVGTLCTVHRLLRAADQTMRVLVQGTERIRIVEVIQTEPYIMARILRIPENVEEGLEVEALARNARDQFTNMAELIPSFPKELAASINSLEDPLQTVYQIVNYQRIELQEAQTLLEIDSVTEKLRRLAAFWPEKWKC